MPKPGRTRLTRDDWLAAGERLLAAHGHEALKAEPMARHLGTTKGSFYWHFEDVAAFHAALLSRWERAALAALEEPLAAEGAAAARLRALAQSIADPGSDAARLEAALRAWGVGFVAARAALARVDAARRSALQELLRATGIGNPEMARILHAAAIGMGLLPDAAPEANRSAIGSLVDLVLALR